VAKRRYSSEADPTRDRILAAALDCVSRTAVGSLSVRAVAAAAGVNVATVHYYFRTKDALVSEAFRLFFAPILGRITSLDSGGGGERARLEGFLFSFLEQLHEHPGIFASLIEAIMASNVRKDPEAPTDYEEILMGIVGAGKERLFPLVAQISGIEEPELLAFTTLRMMMSVVHPMLLSTLPGQLLGLDFADEGVRRRYVACLVESLPSRSEAEEAKTSATTPRT